MNDAPTRGAREIDAPTRGSRAADPSRGPRRTDAGAAEPWAGRAAFVLGLVSTVVYFMTSEGIHNFAGFVATAVHKALHAFGVA